MVHDQVQLTRRDDHRVDAADDGMQRCANALVSGRPSGLACGHLFNVAGKVHSEGVELAGAIRPIKEWKLWGNVAFVNAEYIDFVDSVNGVSFAGNTPPNIPRIVVNAGTSYRFATRWPLELGVSVRHVGDRFVTDDNAVTMRAYTIADAECHQWVWAAGLPLAAGPARRR